MKTSEEIYNRIMTDPNLNKNLFVMTYRDVVKNKYIDMPATSWVSIAKGGIIPFHRVDYIKFEGRVIWDRPNRICIIDECIKEDETNQILPNLFTITTANVLSDEYEKSITNISKRIGGIMEFLSDDKRDIICLQEVQPILLIEINKLTDCYVSNTTMGFNDIVIITKIKPVSHEIIDLGQQKSALVVTLKLSNDSELHIVGIHLTSNYHDDSSSKRVAQLFKIKNKLKDKTNVIMLGDTNEIIYEHKLTHFTNYTDCFLDLNNTNENRGLTYDPSTNVLANKMSKNKTPLRLDRILYTKNNTLNCNEIIMQSDITFSDHYPLTAKFAISENVIPNIVHAEIPSEITNQTALCIIPPYELWETINNLKVSRNDLQDVRWMPHLNIFFGFAQPECFYLIHKNITKLDIVPFSIIFNKIDYFSHEKTFTLFLKPSEESIAKLKNLYTALSTVFKSNKMSYAPHITLGNFTDESKVTNYLKQQVNIRFTFDTLHFVSRIGYDHFKVVKCLSLINTSLDYYINFVKTISANIGVECLTCGSRMFIESVNSQTDADLLARGIMPRDKYFEAITKIAETCGYFRKVTVAKNKYVYCLKLKTNDNNIDIQYINTNDTEDVYYKTGLAIFNEPTFMISRLGNKLELFKECLIWTKDKLKSKKMYGAMFCFIGGLTTAILVAVIVSKRNVTNLQTFIDELKLVDYDKPIALGSNNCNLDNPCDRKLYIGTATAPIENTVRHICRSTAFLLKDQFRSGFESNPSHLFVKTTTFVINATDDEALEGCIEWFNGIVTMMMVAIERNSKDIILFPSNEWIINENGDQMEATWLLQYSHDYASLHYTAGRVVDKSKALFTNAFLSYK